MFKRISGGWVEKDSAGWGRSTVRLDARQLKSLPVPVLNIPNWDYISLKPCSSVNREICLIEFYAQIYTGSRIWVFLVQNLDHFVQNFHHLTAAYPTTWNIRQNALLHIKTLGRPFKRSLADGSGTGKCFLEVECLQNHSTGE